MIKGGATHTAFNTKQPKITIITVVLNGIRFVEGYLANVTPFINADIELVIIDGNSTDGTIEVLAQHDSQIDYWASEPDAGIYDAMNKGIMQAKGQWLYFMGVDDRLMDGFTEVASKLENKNTIYYGNVLSYGKLIAREYDAYYLTKLNICHQAIFYPRAVFSKYQYDTRYLVYADYHLNLKCWQDSDFKFEHCDVLIASFPGGGFSTYTHDNEFDRDRDRLFKRYLGASAYYRYINRTKGAVGVLRQILAG